MKIYYMFFFLMFFSNIYSQDEEHIKIEEEINGKRLELYVTNTDTLSYDVFLKINTTDYRRPSKRPVLKTIGPKSRVHMITLIKLNNKEGRYEPLLIANKVAHTLNVRKDDQDLNLKIDKAFTDKTVYLISDESCKTCPKIEKILHTNYIKFINLHKIRDKAQIIKLFSDLQAYKMATLKSKQKPILKIESHIYTDISTIKNFMDILNEEFKELEIKEN